MSKTIKQTNFNSITANYYRANSLYKHNHSLKSHCQSKLSGNESNKVKIFVISPAHNIFFFFALKTARCQ